MIPHNDILQVPKGAKGGISFQVYKQTGCHRYILSEFKNNQNITPFPKSNKKSRSKLGKSLILLDRSRFFKKIYYDTRYIIQDIQKKVCYCCLQNFKINPCIISEMHADNICIECTLVREACVEHGIYTNLLFTSKPVMQYIVNSTIYGTGSQLRGKSEIIKQILVSLYMFYKA